VGTATLNALAHFPEIVKKVISRTPSKVSKLATPSLGFELVEGGMDNPEELVVALRDCDAAVMITPGVKERVDLMKNAIKAAKEAGLRFIVVPTGLPNPDKLNGLQMLQVEETVKGCGLGYAIVRCPLFYENQRFNKASIRDEGIIYGAMVGDKSFSSVSVDDAGRVCASIVTDPGYYFGSTFSLVGQKLTYNDIAAAFSKVLKRKIKYQQLPYDQALSAMVDAGMPEWQAKGVLEAAHLINNDTGVYSYDNVDIEDVTNMARIPFLEWVETNSKGSPLRKKRSSNVSGEV